jgi:hypothetical protein
MTLSIACRMNLHSQCIDINCECGCHPESWYPDTGESGQTYDMEMKK